MPKTEKMFLIVGIAAFVAGIIMMRISVTASPGWLQLGLAVIALSCIAVGALMFMLRLAKENKEGKKDA